MNHHASRQRGVVLVVSLLMIAVLALLATASINLTSGGLLVANNNRAEAETTTAANQVVEEALSDLGVFVNKTPLPEQTRGDFTVARTAPVCVQRTVLSGFSLTNPLSLQHNYYQFRVIASEPFSGAETRLETGVRILRNAGTCT